MAFDFEGLARFLAENELQTIVADRESPRADWRATRLDTGDGELRQAIRSVLQRSLAGLRRRQPVDYVEGWTPDPGTYSLAPARLATGPLITTLVGAYSAASARDPLPTAALSGETAETDDDISARMIGVVARRDDKTLVIVRAQSPLTHMAPDRVTAILRGNRLSLARTIFAYDGRIDVLVFGDQAIIVNPVAFESLVRDPADLQRELAAALNELEGTNLIGDMPALRTTAGDDSNFARGLRRIHKAGYLTGMQASVLGEAISRWGHDQLSVIGGRLVFRPDARWEFLRVLDDGYLTSDLTGLRYEVNSKRRWNRVQVTGIERDANGRPLQLLGNGAWSPRSVGDVLQDLDNTRTQYHVALDDGVVLIRPRTVGGLRTLWAGPDDGPNLLDRLPVAT